MGLTSLDVQLASRNHLYTLHCSTQQAARDQPKGDLPAELLITPRFCAMCGPP